MAYLLNHRRLLHESRRCALLGGDNCIAGPHFEGFPSADHSGASTHQTH
jgi:hypothetical protein